MSLEPNNTIGVGGFSITLQKYESASIPAQMFTAGSKLAGSGFFTVGSDQNAADLLVPDDFAGTEFVVPHIAGNHRYYFLSPVGNAQVTIRIGTSSQVITANQGVPIEFDAGSDNTVAGRVTASAPILLTHVAYLGGSARDAYPVAPATMELLGVRSQNTTVAALSDGTTVTAYASNGASTSITLNAGQQYQMPIGLATGQGQGSALRLSANAPVAAIQFDDGDGTDTTAFWGSDNFARYHAIPIDAQYIAVACDRPATLALYKGSAAPEFQNCAGSVTAPGKVYFGAAASGPNIARGSYLVSSAPVYLFYEAATPEDEHNSLGVSPPAGPSSPSLDTPPATTGSNPLAIGGTAGTNQTVRLYVNGKPQSTTTANASGAYSFDAALFDGPNVLYVTAVAAGNESDPSNAVAVTYSNTIPRSQAGVISSNVVWTAGVPATPYVITNSLTIAAGATLTLQAGTQLRFASGTTLDVQGRVNIAGTADQPVLLTSNLSSPTRGSWGGVQVSGNAGTSIQYAIIEYASTGVTAYSVPITVRNSTIRLFQSIGIRVDNAGSAGTVIRENLIDNANDTGNCIEVNNSAPQIVGNTLSNCNRGIYVFGAATPVVNGNNLITGNNFGIAVHGASGVAAAPTVNGNQIYGNNTFAYQVTNFGAGGADLKLDATGNWWGGTDGIAATISDLSDSLAATLPSVNYANYLSGPGGTAVPGNYLLGKLTTSSTLVAGSTYTVLGALFVNNGVTLTVPAGTTLRFKAQTPLLVDGALIVQGASGNPAIFTSGKATPASNDWTGLSIRAAGSSIEYARIEYTASAIAIAGVAATVRSSSIAYFLNDGVNVSGSGAAATVVQGNTIDNLNDTGDCIEVSASSPLISGNTLTNCDKGVNVTGASNATVNGGNLITGNRYGLYVDGGGNSLPAPVVTANQLSGNSQFNYYTATYGSGGLAVTLNATGNWWGTTNPVDIGTSIRDFTDAPTTVLPTVNFGGYLSAAGGPPVSGNFLAGRIVTSTTLTAGTTYDVIATIAVNAGATLTIPAGTTLRFVNRAALLVDGTLNLQGTSANPIIVTSGRATPGRTDWDGIQIRAGSAAVVEYAQISYAATGISVTGVAATLRNNTIRNFNADGIFVTGAGASGTLIQGNLIDNVNDTGDCIEANASSPTISGNTLTNCAKGISLTGAGNTTVINGGNIITSNNYGIAPSGSGSPNPVVNANQIFANATRNFFADSYSSAGKAIRINATGNWWGSTVIPTISAGIWDVSDSVTSSTLPTVDYANFLNGPNGAPVTANYLIGRFASSTSLTLGLTYEVLGALFVNTGTTLTVPAGVTLRFHIRVPLVAEGVLSVQGTAASPVVLTSGLTPAAQDQWVGVQLKSNGSLIDFARIEYAYTGVDIAGGVTAIVRNSTLQFSKAYGILIYADAGAAATSTVIHNNIIDSNGISNGAGIYVWGASPTISANRITGCNSGIYLSGNSNTTLINGNNIVTGNGVGIAVGADSTTAPWPVVNGNQIYANLNYNFTTREYGTQPVTALNAKGNWWGTTDAIAIAASIRDRQDSYDSSMPVVDFSGYLSGPDGTPVGQNELIGPVAATLTAGAVYRVLGITTVPAGQALSVPAGTVLQFQAGARLVVDGTLSILGSATAKVRLGSAQPTPARGDWYGIEVRATAKQVTIDHAVIEWAERGVSAVAADVIISNSSITNFSNSGVRLMSGTAASQISNTLIDNGPMTAAGYGIHLTHASPGIFANQVRYTNIGIFAVGASRPNISANRLENNNRGIVLDGYYSSDASSVPNPTITGNDLLNSGAQLELYRYAASNPVVVQALNNWWGVSTPNLGTEVELTGDSPSSVVSFTGAAGPIASSASALSINIAQPANGSAVADRSVVVTGSVTGSADVSLQVNDALTELTSMGYLRTFSVVVPLESGTNLITLVAAQQDGTTVQRTLQVSRTGETPFAFVADPDTGVAPLQVNFELQKYADVEIDRIEIDFEGDGVIDVIDYSNARTFSRTYASVGSYPAQARIYAKNGSTYSYVVPITVNSASEMDRQIRQTWSAFVAAVTAGNQAQALTYIDSDSSEQYTQVFTALGSQLPSFVAGLSDLVAVQMYGGIAEYAVVRTAGSEQVAFLIYLVRDGDGVWRITSM